MCLLSCLVGLEVQTQDVIKTAEPWKPAAPAGLHTKDCNSRHTPEGRAVITSNQPCPSKASSAPSSGDGFRQSQGSQRGACGLGCEARAGGGEEPRGFRASSAAGWVGAFRAPFIEAAVAGLGAGSGKRRRGWKMPVHSRGDKKETNHHDEMEVDYAENEGSSSEDEDTESSSVSEDGDSSGARPSGAGILSRRAGRATGRSPHAGWLRPSGRAGRGKREGAETGSWPRAAPGPVAGLCPAPGRSQSSGQSRAGLGSPSCRMLRHPAPSGTHPWNSRQYPGTTNLGGERPATCQKDRGNAFCPQTTGFFPYFHISNPYFSACVGCWG